MLAEGDLESKVITRYNLSVYQGNAVCSFSNIYSSSRVRYNQGGSDIIKIDYDDHEEGPNHMAALEKIVDTYIHGNPPEIGFETQLRLYGISFVRLEGNELGVKMLTYNLRPKVYSFDESMDILAFTNTKKEVLSKLNVRSTFTVPQMITELRNVSSADVKDYVNEILKAVAIYEATKIAYECTNQSV